MTAYHDYYEPVRYVPHETHYNDPHINFERIKAREIWEKLEQRLRKEKEQNVKVQNHNPC